MYTAEQQNALNDLSSESGDKVAAISTMESNRTAIVNLILECSKEATKKPEESKFDNKLNELVRKLKAIFKSDYCAIGTVDDKYVIDRACTVKLSNDIKWAPIDSQTILVCKSLGYTYNNICREHITHYNKDALVAAGNYEKYKVLLNKDPENSTIIIIQDDDGDPHGFLQFINSESAISKEDYELYKAEMLRLAFVVKQWFALEDERQFLKDFSFIDAISGDTENVDTLFSKIMDYLSTEFNTGVISFRIPLLVGTDKEPKFFLRDCYVSSKIPDKEKVKEYYFKKRLVINLDKMGGRDKLICKYQNTPVIDVEPVDSGNEIGISQDIAFKKNVVIIPIIRDHSEGCRCNIDSKNDSMMCQECKERFEKYYGVFKLRILKSEDDGEDDSIPDEIQIRLQNLAKHISVLLNTTVAKEENESLKTFQIGLNDSSITGINKFDLQCAKTIKESTGAIGCAIYKYDKLSNKMVLSATTSENIRMNSWEGKDNLHFSSDLETAINNCRQWFPLEEDVYNQVFESNGPVYYVLEKNVPDNSMMMIPMMKKEGTRLGMVILIGKDNKTVDISKTYWEQDKKYIEFMVDILSRIEESDADRLVFLIRLSHELRRPITEMVNKNDLLLSTAKRNRDTISKKELIEGLDYNMNSCMRFKQIIGDVEASYYRRKIITYNFENYNVKKCLLDVMRLYEQVGGIASNKGLTFITYLSQMPQTMYVDKDRIKQVFDNILKNAIQYSDNYSTIIISYNFNEKDNCHEIDIKNYGIGIAEEEKENIFKLWKRGEAAKKKRPNGTGMGLSIVKEIMEAHGGKCYVKRLNNPTIFTVSIPNQ